jgi:hypothetical protein
MFGWEDENGGKTMDCQKSGGRVGATLGRDLGTKLRNVDYDLED